MPEQTTLQPHGENLRRALRWLSDERLHRPDAPRATLIGEASVRFDLSPNESEFLLLEWDAKR